MKETLFKFYEKNPVALGILTGSVIMENHIISIFVIIFFIIKYFVYVGNIKIYINKCIAWIIRYFPLVFMTSVILYIIFYYVIDEMLSVLN